MSLQAKASMTTIGRFIQEMGQAEKRAAEAHTEPGSIGGPTSHPVKDVDDNTEEAKEGFRSAENTADVKAEQGKPSVDSTSKNVAAKKAVDGKSESGSVNPPGTASDDQIQIGTKKEPTGEDPSTETNSAKAEKEDSSGSRLGKTTHPARTNNSELDGFKYAEMATDQLVKLSADLGHNLLAALANATVEPATKSASQEDLNKLPKEDKQAADLAGQAGWELAGLLSGDFDKQAADNLVQESLYEMLKVAHDDADKVAYFVTKFYQQKQANDPMAGGMPPEAAGGMPPEAAGGMPPEAAGGPPPGAGGDEAALQELQAVLDTLGIGPEELIAALQQGGEGGGAGGPPPGAGDGAGATPPAAGGDGDGDEAASDKPGMEVEASDKSGKKSTKKAEANKQSAANYVREILERSRR